MDGSMSGLVKFCQEYPACASEAFAASMDSDLIDRDVLAKAYEKKMITDSARIIIGVDVAGSGKDKTVFCIRKGREILDFFAFQGLDTDQIVEKIIKFIQYYKPVKVFIDKGYNPGVVDRITSLKWGDIAIGVHFGGSPDEDKYYDKRAEMYWRGIGWIEDQPCYIPYVKEFNEELCMQERMPPDTSGRMRLRSKDDLRKKLKRSTDYSDAFALTFAYNVFLYDSLEEEYQDSRNQNNRGDPYTGY